MFAARKNAFVLAAACLAAVLLPTSITGTSVTLPAIIDDLGGSVVQLQWVVHAYDLAFASFMLPLGSMSDIYGRRRIFVGGMALYGACALAASLAPNLLFLDLVRGLTGIAAAALMTCSAAALAQTFSGRAQAKAFGLFGTAFGTGLAFGPLLGGGMVSAFGWQAFFLAQVVLAALALGCAFALPGRTSDSRQRVDVLGAGLFVAALFAFILALVEAPQLGVGDPLVYGCFLAFVVLGAGFVAAELRSDHPMFDLSLLRQPRYAAVCIAPVSLAFGFVALLVFVPTYLITAHSLSPWNAGLFMMALTLPTLVMPAVAGGLVARGVSPRALMVLCMTLVAAGGFWLTTIDYTASLTVMALPLVVIGTGFGISNGILDAAAATSVEPRRAGVAVGMFNTTRIAGEVIAIAVAGSLIVAFLRGRLSDQPELAALADGRTPGQAANSIAEGRFGELLESVPSDRLAAFADWALTGFDHAMHSTYFWMALICTLTIPVMTYLRSPGATADAGETAAAEPPVQTLEAPEVPIAGVVTSPANAATSDRR